MRRLFPVILGVTALIPAATDVAADEANPEIIRAVTDAAKVRG